MENKSFESFISCEICFEMYDQSSKRPRVLACGHSFCHSCLELIMQDRLACCPNCDKVILFDSVQSIPINFSMESVIDLGFYEDRQPNCYTKIKKQIDQRIDNEMEIIQKSLENLSTQTMELTLKLNSLKQIQIVVKNSRSDTEISNVMSRIDSLLHKVKKPIAWDSLSSVSLGSLCREQPVYAVDEQDGAPLYGKLAVKQGRIWVDSFQSENPQCRSISLKDLLAKFTNSTELPDTGFLQFTPDDDDRSSAFDVVIQTDGSTPRAKNFILLCSALKGATYKGMAMQKWKTVSYRSGDGPSPVVKKFSGQGVKKPQLQERDVYGMWINNSWFNIQLENEPTPSYLKFGIVLTGIQNLKDCQGSISVTQCGLVI